MRMYHRLERGIKLPNKSVDKIFHGILFTILSDMIAEFGEQVYDLESVFGIELGGLLREYKQEVRKINQNQSVFLIGTDIDSIPYYHTSTTVCNKLKNIESGEVLIKCCVDTTGAYVSEGEFDPRRDVMTINAYRLVTACRYSLIGNGTETVRKEALRVYKVIQHEMMHVMQVYALPEDQNLIRPQYHHRDALMTTRHDDYYTSTAELKPYLANMQEQFINNCVHDSFWETFTNEQRRDVFKMFVGMKSEPMLVMVGGQDIFLKVPCAEFFNALKNTSPRLHQSVVKDFYKTLAEFY